MGGLLSVLHPAGPPGTVAVGLGGSLENSAVYSSCWAKLGLPNQSVKRGFFRDSPLYKSDQLHRVPLKCGLSLSSMEPSLRRVDCIWL